MHKLYRLQLRLHRIYPKLDKNWTIITKITIALNKFL